MPVPPPELSQDNRRVIVDVLELNMDCLILESLLHGDDIFYF